MAVLLLGLTACKSDETSPTATEQVERGPLIGPYIAMGDTLAADSLEQLPEQGAKLVQAATGMSGTAGVDAIMQGAGRVAAQDIATARQAYEKISEGVIAYLKANPEQRKGLMLIHCTMAFKNQGASWVQPEGKIRNPYEGSMMLRCGDKLGWDEAPPAAPGGG